MTPFAALLSTLDSPSSPAAKTAALASYFSNTPDSDKLWTIALLSGRRPKRAATTTELKAWACEIAKLPDWLIEECLTIVGDRAETLAHLLPPARQTSDIRLTAVITRLLPLPSQPQDIRRAAITDIWDSLPSDQRFIFNKLVTGSFRIGVPQALMTRALSQVTGIDESTLAHRLMGNWTPQTTTFRALIHDGEVGAKPYPLALSSPLEADPETLGPPTDWIAEWIWDGIRSQLIHRPATFALWSRGEELITDRFPEFACLADFLPLGTVIDAEVLAWRDNAPLGFAALQSRINRKTVSKKQLAETPARLLAFDLMEDGGRDIRTLPLSDRRTRLAAIIKALPADLPLALSPTLGFSDWENLTSQRATARENHAEGVMLKRAASAYHTGRERGDWWKWKVDPFSVDAVMIYAQAGHDRRATLFTDFTFAVRNGNDLVPFTKARSGLTDDEVRHITQWVGKNTLERFGPVRKVPPELVFEIAFEGIQASPRHKSGIALRFPRMARWRHDKTPDQIDTLDSLRALLAATAS